MTPWKTLTMNRMTATRWIWDDVLQRNPGAKSKKFCLSWSSKKNSHFSSTHWAGHSDPEIKYARTNLMVSEELQGILRRWYNLPRSLNHKIGKRPGRASWSKEHDFVTLWPVPREASKWSVQIFLPPTSNLARTGELPVLWWASALKRRERD